MVFPSKVDGWLVALMAVPVGISVAATTAALLAHPPLPAGLIAVGVEALVLGLILWTFRSTLYQVTDRELIVRSGPFRWTIPISDVESVRPSRSPLSSPALSLDRLEIRYAGGRMLMISPKDREGFLETLVSRSRDLHRAGEHVRRQPVQ
jgi:membrane protein YdbS with pleckstrin-like domain